MEVDFEKGKVIVRDDLEYSFKELVTRKELRKIKEIRDKHSKLEDEGIEKLTPKDVEKLETEWFNVVLPLAYDGFKIEDMDTLTEGEIRELASSGYVFLTKFGSTALAKQYVSSMKEATKKEPMQ